MLACVEKQDVDDERIRISPRKMAAATQLEKARGALSAKGKSIISESSMNTGARKMTRMDVGDTMRAKTAARDTVMRAKTIRKAKTIVHGGRALTGDRTVERAQSSATRKAWR
ncbi:hypothetical protein EW146_g9752 [Bondarzewia mesenterica]|uniref:Uncharacterized protein n=1 Tax=Bondarzewia mesenterica TaxID=1095465 RepID=A0A4S4L3N2_9AGAM|nr:hypothetical protein EW146_g9752 [Bondarzewia mesenterica]